MTEAILLQSKIESNLLCDVEDEALHKLSYDFKKKLLREKNWIKIDETEDGFNNEIFKNENINFTYCIISKGRPFCFVTNPNVYNNNSYWFKSEVIFETILNNIIIEKDDNDCEDIN